MISAMVVPSLSMKLLLQSVKLTLRGIESL